MQRITEFHSVPLDSVAFSETPAATRKPWIVAYYRSGWEAAWRGLPRECPWGAVTTPARVWLSGWDAAMGVETAPIVRRQGVKRATWCAPRGARHVVRATDNPGR